MLTAVIGTIIIQTKKFYKMGLLDLFKRTAPGQTIPLTPAQVDSNWQKIMDLFPTPAAGTTDVGRVPALKADKTGFEFVSLPGNELFPNEFITTSRVFQSSDVGKILVLFPNVKLSMPAEFPFQDGDNIRIYAIDETGSFELFSGRELFPFAIGGESINETLLLKATTGDFPLLSPISSAVIDGKTALRYLYEKSGLSGTATLVDGSVTVTNANVKTGAKIVVSVETPSGTQGFLSAPMSSITDGVSFVINSSSATDTSVVNYYFTNP